MKKAVVILLAAVIALGGNIGTAGASDPATPTPVGEQAAVSLQPGALRIDPWMLLQSSGDELYEQMCSSCHGDQGRGGRLVSHSATMSPPPLNNLETLGIGRDHWVYVIESSCNDAHHRNPDGSQAMPCWKQAFREALDKDAATMLVSTKLADYLETLQEGQR